MTNENTLTGPEIDAIARDSKVDDFGVDYRCFARGIIAALQDRQRREATSAPGGARLIGYITQHDIDFPFMWPSLGPKDERNGRTIPVFAGERAPADAAEVEALLAKYIAEHDEIANAGAPFYQGQQRWRRDLVGQQIVSRLAAAPQSAPIPESPAEHWPDNPLVPIEPGSRKGKPPCGECHLKPGERCDICAASAPEPVGALTDEAITTWVEGFIKKNAYNYPVACQIAMEAAKFVRQFYEAGLSQQPAAEPVAPEPARCKTSSYEADGVVLVRFKNRAGAERLVFEFNEPTGMLHIFNPGQVSSAELAAEPVAAKPAAEPVAELRMFHEFFRDRGEQLFATFGMKAIDLYNACAEPVAAKADGGETERDAARYRLLRDLADWDNDGGHCEWRLRVPTGYGSLRMRTPDEFDSDVDDMAAPADPKTEKE